MDEKKDKKPKKPKKDKREGWKKAQDGISAAEENAGPEWRDAVDEFAIEYASHHKWFTSEEVKLAFYERFPEKHPPNENAWGGRPQAWKALKICIRTDRIYIARAPISHCHKLWIYESIIYEEK